MSNSLHALPLLPSDVPDIVCQEYAVPHMQTLIPKIPGGYVAARCTQQGPPPLNSIFPKPPPVPPPPSEKYYAATAICKSNGNLGQHPHSKTLNGGSGGASAALLANNPSNPNNAKTLPMNAAMNNLSVNHNGQSAQHHSQLVHSTSQNGNVNNISGEEEEALCSSDEDFQVDEFPRQSLTIVEKLGSGQFGDFHICETKGTRWVATIDATLADLHI